MNERVPPASAPQPEAPMRRIKRAFKAIGAAMLATGCIQSCSFESQPIKLNNIPNLLDGPGSKLALINQQRSGLEASAVSIVRHDDKTSTGVTCSGNAVEYLSEEYIEANAHCFADATWLDDALLGPQGGDDEALDYIKLEPSQVSIKDQSYMVDITVRDARKVWHYKSPPPMAGIKGLAIGLGHGDDALLLPDTAKAVNSSKSRTLNQVLPLTYNPAITPPDIGQPVALYSMPGHNTIGVSATGIYAGRMTLFDERRKVDVVVEHSDDEAHDPCAVGGSGSTAIVAEGHQLIGLSAGENYGYGKENYLFSPNQDARESSRRQWRQLEHSLGVNIPTNYNTFCFFDVKDKQTMPNLVRAFGVYATRHAIRYGN